MYAFIPLKPYQAWCVLTLHKVPAQKKTDFLCYIVNISVFKCFFLFVLMDVKKYIHSSMCM